MLATQSEFWRPAFGSPNREPTPVELGVYTVCFFASISSLITMVDN